MGRCSRNASLPHRLLLNGGGTFTDVASAAGLTTGSPAAACTGVALSDVNNDGAVDVVFTGPSSTRLLVNSGGGVFSDVASLWGIATSACTAAAWADVDLDGDVDAWCVTGASTSSLLLSSWSVAVPWFDDYGGVVGLASGNVGGSLVAAAVVDVDGDGDGDVPSGAVLNPRCHRGTLTATVLVVRTEASPGFPRAFDCASLTRIHGVVRRVTVGDDAFKPHL